MSRSGSSVSSTPVYVRVASASVASGASDTPSGNVTCESTNATTQNVAVSATVYNSPTSAAGNDITQCATSSFTLAATNPSFGSGAWTVSSGSATISSASSYNSGVTSVTAGNSATLTWTVSNGSCSDATDDVVLTNTATPNAGTLSGTQAINPTSVVSVTSDGDAGGAWSSNNGFVTIDAGTGVATGGASNGSSTITYTVSASPCTDATATIVLTVSNDYLTTGVNSNWSNTACWGGGVVPPSSGNVTISHNVTVDASTNALGQ